jgi:hypothetical protein
VARLVGQALRDAPFETEQGGALFLRTAAERAIKSVVGGARVVVAGRDGAQVGGVTFMGTRFAPDLVVEAPGGARVGVTLTLLRGDATPVAGALATALALAASPRYGAVVAFLLDRRLGKHDPFADPAEAGTPVRDLAETERAFVARLWDFHGVLVEVRRQDPFGWG